MGSVRFADLQTRPPEVLDWTSLTWAACQLLVPPFYAMFQAPMADWRPDGTARAARRDTTDQTCPRPTPEERLRLILVDLKTSPLHVVQGRRYGMDKPPAHPWMHGLWVVLRATRRRLEDAPRRSVQA